MSDLLRMASCRDILEFLEASRFSAHQCIRPSEEANRAWHSSGLPFHPNQKPLGAVAQLLTAFSKDCSVVLDPFSGSGTTLLAAKACGRKAVGIEIEERFCEITTMRLSQEVLQFSECGIQTIQTGEETL